MKQTLLILIFCFCIIATAKAAPLFAPKEQEWNPPATSLHSDESEEKLRALLLKADPERLNRILALDKTLDINFIDIHENLEYYERFGPPLYSVSIPEPVKAFLSRERHKAHESTLLAICPEEETAQMNEECYAFLARKEYAIMSSDFSRQFEKMWLEDLRKQNPAHFEAVLEISQTSGIPPAWLEKHWATITRCIAHFPIKNPTNQEICRIFRDAWHKTQGLIPPPKGPFYQHIAERTGMLLGTLWFTLQGKGALSWRVMKAADIGGGLVGFLLCAGIITLFVFFLCKIKTIICFIVVRKQKILFLVPALLLLIGSFLTTDFAYERGFSRLFQVIMFAAACFYAYVMYVRKKYVWGSLFAITAVMVNFFFPMGFRTGEPETIAVHLFIIFLSLFFCITQIKTE